MSYTKKMIVLMLMASLVAGLFGSIPAYADEITIATPKISIKVAENETGIKVTIGKKKSAESEAFRDKKKDGDYKTGTTCP